MNDTTNCPTDAHVHFRPFPVSLPYGHLVMLDGRPIAVCTNIAFAYRLADLLNTHGPVAVPDRIPDSIMWGPPLLPALIDPRLPEDPTVPTETDHQWRYDDQRDVFVCTLCGTIEEAR